MRIRNGRLIHPSDEDSIVSVPIEDGLKIVNIFIDPETGKVTVQYEDNS